MNNIEKLEFVKTNSVLADKNLCWMGSKEENNDFEILIKSLGSTAKISQPSTKVNYYIWPKLSQTRMFIYKGTDANSNTFVYSREHLSHDYLKKLVSKIKSDIKQIYYKEFNTKLNKNSAKKITNIYPFLINLFPDDMREYCVLKNNDLFKFLTNIHANNEIKRKVIHQNAMYFVFLSKDEQLNMRYKEAAIFSKENCKKNLIKKLSCKQIESLDYSLVHDPSIFKLIWKVYLKKYNKKSVDPFVLAAMKKRFQDLTKNKKPVIETVNFTKS